MRTRLLAWTMLLSFLAIPVYGQDRHDSLVRDLYVKSGMKEQLVQLPTVIQIALDQQYEENTDLKKLPKNVLSTIRGLVPQAFAENRMKNRVIEELSQGMTDEEIQETLAWLNSPIGEKCTKLEEAAASPEAFSEMQDYGEEIKKSPPSAERLQALRKLDSAARFTEGAVEMTINLQTAVALAVIATLPAEKRLPPEEIEREMQKDRPALESQVRSQTFVQLVYTYRSLSNEEVASYVKFATSPTGKKYTDISELALRKATLEGGLRWGRAVGEAIQNSATQSDA